ncbi:hypothetical protein J2Z17_003883 [Rhizobium halophytocola]|uniref:Uncharacterized protein n=1 Tax=Rhizobium halophytocola TaxID=735519 RepID=A0ABS4E3C8_9HYPH|nr:hypothetical protein [Rhizobium halophytocola]
MTGAADNGGRTAGGVRTAGFSAGPRRLVFPAMSARLTGREVEDHAKAQPHNDNKDMAPPSRGLRRFLPGVPDPTDAMPRPTAQEVFAGPAAKTGSCFRGKIRHPLPARLNRTGPGGPGRAFAVARPGSPGPRRQSMHPPTPCPHVTDQAPGAGLPLPATVSRNTPARETPTRIRAGEMGVENFSENFFGGGRRRDIGAGSADEDHQREGAITRPRSTMSNKC